MKNGSIQLLLTVVAAFISLTFFMAPTYGSSIVIGGNWTDIGTITFVSPKPGDSPTTAGTALLNTINAITDNSATNPYLIKLGPGIYDLGTGSLQMKEYVDVEGSGENTTTITGQIDSGGSGVIRGANNAEIRLLAVRNNGGGTQSTAFYASRLDTLSIPPPPLPPIVIPSTLKMTHVTASASGGTYNYGIVNDSSSPTMTNVTVSASGGSFSYGVVNYSSSSATMTNVTVSASGSSDTNYGVDNIGSSPTMTNVRVSASGESPFNYGVYNVTSSPTMTNVTIFASGGQNGTGVFNLSSSSPTMKNVTAIVSGGNGSYIGVLNDSSSPTMTNVTVSASASEGKSTLGVFNNSSSPTMTNVMISASGATTNKGVNSSGTGTIMIHNSVIMGSTNTIINDTNTTTRVANTKLDGGPVSNGGILTCVGTYDENYVALNTSCQ